MRELGVGYIFNEPERYNLPLAREFYAKYVISFGESTKVKIRGQVVWFIAKKFISFLVTPAVGPSKYFIFLEKPPYRDIHHTLCSEHSSARWARDHNGTHSTLMFAYLNREAKVLVKLVFVVFLPRTHIVTTRT
ncbi:hypothetical protein HAX54_012564 [Datura stramonium]|uniref:Putative plant transposon protein domain-containing protein n=1 Tax=Datura stramonium TaxID=4076 RepID=A0ABS8TLT3_DATST|nr:hypothetical protein [Datura stramonium]